MQVEDLTQSLSGSLVKHRYSTHCRVVSVNAWFRQLRSWKLLNIELTLPRKSGVRISQGAPFLQVVQRAFSDNQPLLMRHTGRVVVGDQSPAPMLLYPHSGKASVVGNCVAFILPIHC